MDRDRLGFLGQMQFSMETCKMTEQEKDALKQRLIGASPSASLANWAQVSYYKVPFEQVPHLVMRRCVYVRWGIAYIPSTEISSDDVEGEKVLRRVWDQDNLFGIQGKITGSIRPENAMKANEMFCRHFPCLSEKSDQLESGRRAFKSIHPFPQWLDLIIELDEDIIIQKKNGVWEE